MKEGARREIAGAAGVELSSQPATSARACPALPYRALPPTLASLRRHRAERRIQKTMKWRPGVGAKQHYE